MSNRYKRIFPCTAIKNNRSICCGCFAFSGNTGSFFSSMFDDVIADFLNRAAGFIVRVVEQ